MHILDKENLDLCFGNHGNRAFPVAGAAVDALLLVYLISGVSEMDSFCRTECPARLAAYALATDEVNLGSFGNAGFGSLGFGGFCHCY
jgi:hypothetical protein